MRTTRQSKILEMISKRSIETQDEIVETLQSAGFTVTQATVSRDIKELGLVKVMNESGQYRYAMVDSGEKKMSGKLLNLLREAVVSVASAENLVVIKTLSGSANTAAMAVERMELPEMIGCIAGDDTLLLVISSKQLVPQVINKISEWI